MSVVYWTTPGTSVRRRGVLFQVWQGGAKAADIRLFDLERLVIMGSVQLSTQALGLLLDKGIDVALTTTRGRLRGTLVSGESRNVFLRLAQFDRWRDDAFRLDCSRQVAAAKLTAQDRILSRYARNHPGILEPEAQARLRQCLGKLDAADSVETGRWGETTVATLCGWIDNARAHLELVLLDFGGKHAPSNDVMLSRCSHFIGVARAGETQAESAEVGMASWTGEVPEVVIVIGGAVPIWLLLSYLRWLRWLPGERRIGVWDARLHGPVWIGGTS